MGSNSEYCYSGGADARIHSWKIPDLNVDPYDGYGEDGSLLWLPPPLSTGASSFPQCPPVPSDAGPGGRRGAHRVPPARVSLEPRVQPVTRVRWAEAGKRWCWGAAS